MAVALYPGSFDPIHNGHLAVLSVAADLFDEVVFAVGHNPAKPSGLFTPDERMDLACTAIDESGISGVRVASFTGLVTDAAAAQGANCLLKGVRSVTDLDAEMLQANMNAATGDDLPTVMLPARGPDALVASRYIREIALGGGDVSAVVPPIVAKRLAEKAEGWKAERW